MKTDITKEEALSLLQIAAMEPCGLLVYTSDNSSFIQALYRARKEDSTLQNLELRQTVEGLAICRPPEEWPKADTGASDDTAID